MMSPAQEVRQRFERDGLYQGRTFFLKASKLLEFLRACEQRELAIVGFETFEVHAKGELITPRPELIWQYGSKEARTWSEFRAGCVQDTERAFRELPTMDTLFVVCYDLVTEAMWKMKWKSLAKS